MEAVPGRVLSDGGVSLSSEERTVLWDSVVSAMASLHSVDYKAAGLEGYGKVGNYCERQVKTWQRNFDAADVIVQKELNDPGKTEQMHEVVNWLHQHMPTTEPTCVVHGDIGLHNMIIHPREPKVSAIVDWELSTLGHPYVDVDYVASQVVGGWRQEVSAGVVPLTEAIMPGMPREPELVANYFSKRGLPLVPQEEFRFFTVLNIFRAGAIAHGVWARGLAGNASSGTAANERMRTGYLGALTAAKSILGPKGKL
eukprot:CAMPEP_0204371136 /NCGR_PEP_ID=MMETSP0469-20131031/46258_1 /ASSEMBLY_ACC=CAM_ASM_000384 /TAXON_ID=2969 /ORGANISM="Oxyrrhis marina" /LENGTH=254 /DNA_ID=CAMNT_0051361183 /DNA_START=11 /DNA_END=775 /DNA_ORIENTATION=+